MKKGVKILIAVIAVIVVLGGIAAGLFFGGIFDLLKPTRKTWSSQVQKALDLEGVKLTDYSDYLEEYKDLYNKPFKSNLEITADLSISELDKDVQKTINNSKIIVETSQDRKEKNSEAKISLKSDNSDILELDVVTNDTKMAIGSKDLYDKYLVVSLEDLEDYIDKNSKTSKSSLSSTNVKPSELYKKMSELDPYELMYISKDDLKDIQKTYKDAFKDLIDKKSYTKKANVKVDVDGKDVRTTGYYLTLSYKDTYDLIEGLSKVVKDDDVLAKIISEKASMILEAMGEDKISQKDAEKMLESVMDALMKRLESYSDEFKDDQGFQIAVYSKFGKPVRLEVNYIEDMDDIYNAKTLLSIEYAKNKDIYTILPEESPNVVIIDEYSKKSDKEKVGTLSAKVSGIEVGTVDYEFINKDSEKKFLLNAKISEKFAKTAKLDGETYVKVELSEKGNYKKEPVDILFSVEGKYGNESAKIKVEGTVDYTADVSITKLSSDNSVDILKLNSTEQAKLSDDILKKASEVLPARLKLIGVNVTAEDIYPTKKPTAHSTTVDYADEYITAKKPTEDSTLGKYTEIIKIGFKDNKIVSVKLGMEFDDEKTASSLITALKLSGEQIDGFDFTQEGKQIVVHMDAETFKNQEGLSDSDLSKDALKKALEKEGYTVE